MKRDIKKLSKRKSLSLAVILAAFVFCESMGTAEVKADYRYDSFGNAIPSQYSYVADTDYNGLQLGIGAFNSPTDLYVSGDNRIFIVDAGNDRIVVLNEEYEVDKVIESFWLDGEEVSIKSVTGIFVHSDGLIYLADKDNGRILEAKEDGTIVRVVTRPDSVPLRKA